MPQLFTNNARALLASGITGTATSLTVEASKADLFPTANTGTGSVPSANNWFKATLQDSAGNVEIVYVRTRTAGSGVFSNVIRGQEGTTARAFSAGTVVGLRITAADVEGSIAAAANSVQLTGDQTVAGAKTFTSPMVVSNNGIQFQITHVDTGAFGRLVSYEPSAGLRPTVMRVSNDGTGGTTDVMAWTATGRVGIGTSDPARPLHIVNDDPQIQVSHSSTGAFAQFLSYDLGTGTRPAAIRVSNDGTGGTSDVMTFLSSGNVGVGITPTEKLHVSGNILATGNVTAYSDIRLKTDLTKIADALYKVNQLNGYTYTRRDTGERQTGVVAQEVRAVLPEAVIDNGEHLSVAYGNMVGLLIEAVKELTARLEKLEGR